MKAIELFTLGVLPAFLLLDFIHRARGERRMPWWRTRALLVTTVNFLLSFVVGAFWIDLAGGWTLFDGAALGTVGGALVGVLVYELVHYAYHRAAHRWTWLWRFGHQMHHSPETLDVWGAYYLHPLDAAAFMTWSAVVLFVVLGLSPMAGALAAAFVTFCAVFQHADIRTPRWLGWLIQRPESHRIHHARGVHAFNYSDLPLWDMVFGTFRNPTDAEVDLVEQGFHDGASARVLEMLTFRDVSLPRTDAKPAAAPLTAADAP